MPDEIRARFDRASAPPPEVVPEPQKIALPPHYFAPPYGSQAFFPFGSVTLAAGPVTQIIAGTELRLEPGYVGVVRAIALAVRNVLTTTDIAVQLEVQAQRVAPLRRIPAQAVAYVEREWDGFAYLIPAGGLLGLRVTVADAGAYSVSGYYDGWTMPLADWRRYAGSR